MDLRKVKKLIELVEESAIEELEVSSGDESIRIVMHRGGSAANYVTSGLGNDAADPADAANRQSVSDVQVVAAPMAGTFYRSSTPEAQPFVQIGQTVQLGDVLCIIESMKMMHEIHSTQTGVVKQICVENGQPINTGEALFRLS